MAGCKICGFSGSQVIYTGPVRVGKFGSLSSMPYQVTKCLACKVISLLDAPEHPKAYYESASYREIVDGSAEVDAYYRIHDRDQLRHLCITGTGAFRDKVVADVGCGAGSFLDSIRGYAKIAIGVEPCLSFRESLAQRGYVAFPYVADALREYESRVDSVVSFSVIEHIEDPLSFVVEIHRLLKPEGRLVLSTPNANDVLLEALPEVYPRFFYRKWHLWYFLPEALVHLLERAGYSDIRIIPFHRFGLSNFLAWLRDRSPKGEVHMEFVTLAMNAAWKAELERTMQCDYLFAEALKP